MSEDRDTRLRRMRMRSMRRGIKEMDLILSTFAADRLDGLSEPELETYDAMLSENDQDLYRWVTGQEAAPPQFTDLIQAISAHVGAN